MKGQLATIEAIIAAAIISWVVIFVANASYGMSITRKSANVENAVYDFSNILYKNATAYGCITSRNTGCISNILDEMRSVYGLKYAGLKIGNLSVYSGSACAAYENFCYTAGDNGIACLLLCGG